MFANKANPAARLNLRRGEKLGVATPPHPYRLVFFMSFPFLPFINTVIRWAYCTVGLNSQIQNVPSNTRVSNLLTGAQVRKDLFIFYYT